MFYNRLEAGELLASKLKKYKNDPGIILAVPRGGVPVAYMVAKELKFPVDLILVKKIGHPSNKEYAIGAASLTDHFIATEEYIPEVYIQQELESIRTRLRLMYKNFVSRKEPERLEGKTVIVIDDGMATGNTLLGIINVLRKSKPGKIIIGVPVASKKAVQILSEKADEVVTVFIPNEFSGVGAFYKDFEQVNDEEVKYYLDKLLELK